LLVQDSQDIAGCVCIVMEWWVRLLCNINILGFII
jgi:hypothetical protein